MVITTKYDVGDELLTLDNNKIIRVILKSITSIQEITWLVSSLDRLHFNDPKYFISKKESEMFRTRQELIDSL